MPGVPSIPSPTPVMEHPGNQPILGDFTALLILHRQGTTRACVWQRKEPWSIFPTFQCQAARYGGEQNSPCLALWDIQNPGGTASRASATPGCIS